MTTVTANQTAATVTTGFAARLSAFVEAAGMLSVAAVMALCINAML
ncbi:MULTISPECIES: hypothetical protein [Nitrospirillum]|uniref:Uncharacterized protein n=1 Tax=Nitrospirillum amazonense TaxID=28077 RepID=A0A560FZB5_9PROT|nr:hypothetical protein [Nitrospirillum amazonense]MEC4595085.1 hypothetical protein [Nitrospirillum amazonense]MEC4595087.1 hypothetical protein [Nitrospirillum amazonense]TWB26985.1 hypothetical protein FBZ88_107152 [Nitrospirillum amazonense]TWB26987.1 hypothetical protein FBZ88_107154 [Nitrospirillum amazonense]TWB28110.1 hypothetical protein FBZ91_13024 [Nitrospirillum amazonense]